LVARTLESLYDEAREWYKSNAGVELPDTRLVEIPTSKFMEINYHPAFATVNRLPINRESVIRVTQEALEELQRVEEYRHLAHEFIIDTECIVDGIINEMTYKIVNHPTFQYLNTFFEGDIIVTPNFDLLDDTDKIAGLAHEVTHLLQHQRGWIADYPMSVEGVPTLIGISYSREHKSLDRLMQDERRRSEILKAQFQDHNDILERRNFSYQAQARAAADILREYKRTYGNAPVSVLIESEVYRSVERRIIRYIFEKSIQEALREI